MNGNQDTTRPPCECGRCIECTTRGETPPDGYETWLDYIFAMPDGRKSYAPGSFKSFARAELAALRARLAEAEAMNAEFIAAGAKLGIRLAKLEAKPEPPTPEVGKVYWVRHKGCAPCKAEIIAVHKRVIEFRDYSGAMVTHAAMRDELEIVEETTWLWQ